MVETGVAYSKLYKLTPPKKKKKRENKTVYCLGIMFFNFQYNAIHSIHYTFENILIH